MFVTIGADVIEGNSVSKQNICVMPVWMTAFALALRKWNMMGAQFVKWDPWPLPGEGAD